MIRKKSRGTVQTRKILLLKINHSVCDNVFPIAKYMEWHFSLIKLYGVVQENIEKG